MTVQLRYDLFLNAKTIYEPKMAVDDVFSVKMTDSDFDNNPNTSRGYIKKANLNLMPPLSTKNTNYLNSI
jgi:hypothetical protein